MFIVILINVAQIMVIVVLQMLIAVKVAIQNTVNVTFQKLLYHLLGPKKFQMMRLVVQEATLIIFVLEIIVVPKTVIVGILMTIVLM
jgi:hypothetical protein